MRRSKLSIRANDSRSDRKYDSGGETGGNLDGRGIELSKIAVLID
ncbi:MAG: hypothetical protein ACW99G_21565 [Candidatus Thorarchaeota archaeon]